MNKLHLMWALCAVLLTAIPPRTVHAIYIQLEFIVSDFGPGSEGTVAPQGTVSGSILYEAVSTISTIDSISDIDLMIADHKYLPGDVGYIHRDNQPKQCIGDGLSNGFCNVGSKENDFMIRWHQITLDPAYFAYSTAGSDEVWGTTTFDLFRITAVPIPPSLFLLGSGLLVLFGMARHKKA